MEEWKDIKGYEGLYQVSNYGEERSLDRIVIDKNGREMCFKGKILKPNDNGNGYLFVVLSKNGDVKNHLVHKLVAETFIPNPNNYEEVHHKDHNTNNNRVENLEWIPNERHRESHNIGDKTVYQYSNGELIAVWKSAREIQRVLGYSQGHISDCCRGGHYSHTRGRWVNANTYKGFKWSYTPL